jgi:hypothetical protein
VNVLGRVDEKIKDIKTGLDENKNGAAWEFGMPISNGRHAHARLSAALRMEAFCGGRGHGTNF